MPQFMVRRCLLAALLLSPCQLSAAESTTKNAPAVAAPVDLKAAIADYKIKLAAYTRAREKYDAQATAYWNMVAKKRNIRNAKRSKSQVLVLSDYVETQPPVYAGPPEPINPEKGVPEPPPPKKYVPVVADFLKAAAEHYKFTPQPPSIEIAFKRAYAKAAAAAGLTKEQAVRIYGFESGGDGRYDVQAGLEYPKPDARAISTALGYNQLLATNSVDLLAEKGGQFLAVLKKKAAGLKGKPKTRLEKKIAILDRMIVFSRSVPDEWAEHEKLANTPEGLGIHALNLDIDVGPLLQTQKLLDSVNFARRKGYRDPLTAAELEMMNLTGDGNGFDMVMMPWALREKVPTANFFQPGGYAANPVAIDNNTVAKLIAATDSKMDQEVKLQGAKDLAAAF